MKRPKYLDMSLTSLQSVVTLILPVAMGSGPKSIIIEENERNTISESIMYPVMGLRAKETGKGN